jgi:hypothetical protein
MLFEYSFGNKYIRNFIDDYTKMCWVDLLKQKSQAFETFKNFHLWIENKHQYCIGIIYTDNGEENNYNEFEIYLYQHGIKHKTIVPYNAQKNSVVERMNKTLLNMVCSMLFFKNVKLMFWADEVMCAMYLRNIIPSHSLGKKYFYEMWYDHIPSVRHLKVFGSTCYALIPKEHRNKLGERS